NNTLEGEHPVSGIQVVERIAQVSHSFGSATAGQVLNGEGSYRGILVPECVSQRRKHGGTVRLAVLNQALQRLKPVHVPLVPARQFREHFGGGLGVLL